MKMWNRVINFFAIIGIIIVLGFILAPFVMAKEVKLITDCYKSAEFIATVSATRGTGRSYTPAGEFEEPHHLFLATFVYSNFGERFNGLENFTNYMELCVAKNGNIIEIENVMRLYSSLSKIKHQQR